MSETIPPPAEAPQEFFDNAAIGIHLVGPDGTILRANRAELDMLGYAHDEYVGHHITEFHADRDVVDDILRRLTKGETLERYAARLRCKDGSILHVLIDSNVFREGDRFVHTRCFTRDVTLARHAQDRMEQALAAAQAARAHAEAAERRSAVLSNITRSLTEALDLDVVLERIALGAKDLCASDAAAIFLRDAETDEIVPRYRVGAPLEPYRPLRITPGHGIGGMVMETGHPVRTDDFGTDPRVPAEFQAVAQTTGTIALMVVPISIANRIEGLLYISNTARRPFTDADEAICVRLAHHAAIAIHNATLFRSERAARAEAETANRAKDEFLAVLSHELRTPLTSILGWARLLLSSRLDEERATRALESIERNARLQAQLIGDLLDVSRIVTGKLELDRRAVDLPAVIEAAIEAARPALDAKGLRLTRALSPPTSPILGDPARLQQVVWNLVSNAAKFTPVEGDIVVVLDEMDGHARLVVRDTGPGIPPEVLPHIFDRFRQADSSTRREHGGLGLGLAIARQLVQLHGGTIEARNMEDGSGAVLTVLLPFVSAETPVLRAPVFTAGAGPREGSEMRLRGTRLLVVDDDADARELLAVVLGGAGAEVVSAGSVAEGLAALARVQPTLVLADLGMPGENGYDLVRRIRTLGTPLSHTPVVAVTAYASVQDRDRTLAAGFALHIAKPVEPSALVDAIAPLALPRSA